VITARDTCPEDTSPGGPLSRRNLHPSGLTAFSELTIGRQQAATLSKKSMGASHRSLCESPPLGRGQLSFLQDSSSRVIEHIEHQLSRQFVN